MNGLANFGPILDGHVNVASTRYIPVRFVEEQALNAYTRMHLLGETISQGKVRDMVFRIYEDHHADSLVSEMNDSGISEAVLLAPDFSLSAKCELTPDAVAAAHHAIMKRHPGRFHVFAGVDPRHGGDGLALFERSTTDYGFAGMKLYPPCGYSPSDHRLDAFYEICSERHLPVLVHTGPGWQALDFAFGDPLMLDEASRRFPRVNFILGHGAVTYVEQASYLCMYRSNMYMDISGITSALAPDGWQSHLNSLLRVGLNHKIVFGTSWPAFRLSLSLRRLMNEFAPESSIWSGVRRSEAKLIMGNTLRRLLSARRSETEAAA